MKQTKTLRFMDDEDRANSFKISGIYDPEIVYTVDESDCPDKRTYYRMRIFGDDEKNYMSAYVIANLETEDYYVGHIETHVENEEMISRLFIAFANLLYFHNPDKFYEGRFETDFKNVGRIYFILPLFDLRLRSSIEQQSFTLSECDMKNVVYTIGVNRGRKILSSELYELFQVEDGVGYNMISNSNFNLIDLASSLELEILNDSDDITQYNGKLIFSGNKNNPLVEFSMEVDDECHTVTVTDYSINIAGKNYSYIDDIERILSIPFYMVFDLLQKTFSECEITTFIPLDDFFTMKVMYFLKSFKVVGYNVKQQKVEFKFLDSFIDKTESFIKIKNENELDDLTKDLLLKYKSL